MPIVRIKVSSIVDPTSIRALCDLYGPLNSFEVKKEIPNNNYIVDFARLVAPRELQADAESIKLSSHQLIVTIDKGLYSDNPELNIDTEDKPTNRKLDFGKSPKKFEDYYDDSSDEEGIDEKISNYDVIKKYQEYYREQKRTSAINIEDDTTLSFLAHAAGLSLTIYSPEVNKRYYEIKKKIFSTNEKINVWQQLVYLFDVAIVKAVDQFSIEFLQREKLKDSKESSELKNKLISALKNEIRREIKEDKADVIAEFTNGLISISLLTENLIKAAKKLFAEHEDAKNDGKWIDIKGKIFFAATDQYNYYRKVEMKIASQKDEKGHIEVKHNANNYQGLFTHLNKTYSEMLSVSGNRGNVNKKNLSDDRILSAYLDDLINIDDKLLQAKEDEYNNEIKKLTAEIEASKNEIDFSKKFLKSELESAAKVYKQTRHAKTLISEYYQLNPDSLNYQVHSTLKHFLIKQFKKIPLLFRRPTLGREFTLSSCDPYGFFSNQRTANRSQKRERRNLEYSFSQGETVFRNWKLSKDLLTLETQEILTGDNAGRQDEVLNLGTYKDVNDLINQLKKELRVDDKKIAEFIRAIFQGVKVDLQYYDDEVERVKNKLQDITFLIFGCESTRNPAMHVINQMLLDLIINAGWRWEEALTPGDNPDRRRMPMAPKGAVSAARKLHGKYNSFMPYSYIYEGTEKSKNEKKAIEQPITEHMLIIFEGRIVRNWLKLMNFETEFKELIGKLYPLILPPKETEAILFLRYVIEKIRQRKEFWFGKPETTKPLFQSSAEEKAINTFVATIIHTDLFKTGIGGVDNFAQNTFVTDSKTCQMNSAQRQTSLLYEMHRLNMKYEYCPDLKSAIPALEMQNAIIVLPEIDFSQKIAGAKVHLKTALDRHRQKNKTIFLCLNVNAGHYTTLAIQPNAGGGWAYRYIEPLTNSTDGALPVHYAELEEALIECMGKDIMPVKVAYKKQQFSSKLPIHEPHHYECGMHNVFNTLYMIQQNTISADLSQMKIALEIPGDNITGNCGLDPHDALHTVAPLYRRVMEKLSAAVEANNSAGLSAFSKDSPTIKLG